MPGEPNYGLWSLVATVFFGVVASLLSFYFFVLPKTAADLREQLEDERDRQDILADLRGRSLRQRYQDGLVWFLGRCDRHLGTRFWQVADRCLLIALIYPILLFCLAWAVGGTGSFGDLALLPESDSLLVRLAILSLVIGEMRSFVCVVFADRLDCQSNWRCAPLPADPHPPAAGRRSSH